MTVTARAARAQARVTRAWPGAGAAVTAVWVWVAMVEPWRFTATGGAVGAAAAAVAVVAWRPGPRWGGAAAGALAAPAALALFPPAVALAASGRSAIPLATATAVASIGTASRHHRPELRLAVVAVAGTALLVASVLSSHAARPGWGLEPSGRVQAVGLAGAALALLAAGGVRRARGGPVRLEPLAVAGAAAGIAAAPLPPELGVALAAAAVVAAVAGRPVALTVGAVALAVATVPGARPAALLLIAAAALSVALPRALADLPVLPGVVVMVDLVIGAPLDRRGMVVAAGCAAAVALVALRPRAPLPVWPPHPAAVPALVLGAWLTLLPSTWGFAHTGVGRYDRAVGLAVAAGALAAIAVRAADAVRDRMAG